jgi:hypothetical protein
MKVAKLNDNVLFTFLRDPIVDAIAGATNFKPIQPSDHLKKANNSDLEYNRLFDVEAFDAKFIDGVLHQGEPLEVGNNAKRQKTVIPRRAKEKQMIAELSSRSGACIEQPGQKM